MVRGSLVPRPGNEARYKATTCGPCSTILHWVTLALFPGLACIHCLQYEIHAGFHTASDKCTRPGTSVMYHRKNMPICDELSGSSKRGVGAFSTVMIF